MGRLLYLRETCREALPPSVLPWDLQMLGFGWVFRMGISFSLSRSRAPHLSSFLHTSPSWMGSCCHLCCSLKASVWSVWLWTPAPVPLLSGMMGEGSPSWRSGMEVILPLQSVFSLWQPSIQSQMEGWLRVPGPWLLQMSRQALILPGLCR